MAALVLAGCGGGEERRAAPQPKLPREVATQLAERGDLVAAALDNGDDCRALAEAGRLQQEAIQAINDRRVPGEFQEHLVAAASELVSRIECTPRAGGDDGDNDEGRHNQGKHRRTKGTTTRQPRRHASGRRLGVTHPRRERETSAPGYAGTPARKPLARHGEPLPRRRT